MEMRVQIPEFEVNAGNLEVDGAMSFFLSLHHRAFPNQAHEVSNLGKPLSSTQYSYQPLTSLCNQFPTTRPPVISSQGHLGPQKYPDYTFPWNAFSGLPAFLKCPMPRGIGSHCQDAS